MGWSNRTVAMRLALHALDLGLIPDISYGLSSLLGLILEHRAKSNL